MGRVLAGTFLLLVTSGNAFVGQQRAFHRQHANPTVSMMVSKAKEDLDNYKSGMSITRTGDQQTGEVSPYETRMFSRNVCCCASLPLTYLCIIQKAIRRGHEVWWIIIVYLRTH